jgi:protein gp37
MSDLFHEAVPETFIREVFAVMQQASWHEFQVLTKRSSRLAELSHTLSWPANIWMGVSIESEAFISRARDLERVPAALRFVSFEPLLGPIREPLLSGIDWVLVGGESGARARPMDLEWVRMILAECQREGVPCFLKQLGGRRGKRGGSQAMLDGRLWREFPDRMISRRRKVLPARA